MALYRWLENSRDELIERLSEVQNETDAIAPGREFILAEHANIQQILDDLIAILIPGYRGYAHVVNTAVDLGDQLSQVAPELRVLVKKALEYRAYSGASLFEILRSDSPRDPGTMTEDQRREWFDQRRPVSEQPRYDQTLAPRVVERVRVVHVERPVDYSWVPFTLGLGYLAYRSHRHHRRYHRHHFHYGYHWGW